MRATLQRRRWRRRGFRIAGDAEIAPGVVIEADEVQIGPGVKLLPGTVLQGRSIRLGRRVEMGPNARIVCPDVEIGDDTKLRQNVTVAGLALPDSRLQLGRRIRVFQDTFLNPTKPLVVGDESGLGGRSLIFTHAAWQSELEGYPVEFAPITIGRNVWLPWQVFVLPGVEIGDDVTVAAGSIVSRSIPSRSLAAGYPARVLKREPDWPPTPSPEEQWAIAQRIWGEVAAQLSAALDGLVLESDRGTAALVREGDGPAGAQVVAALHGRPDVAPGVAWLGLLARERGGPPSPFADELAELLSRFGLRFQHVDER